MMLAVDRIQNDGTFEWAPQSGGDFYVHPENDPVASREIVDGDGEWPPIIAEQAPIPPEPEARADVIRRLDELEAIVQPLLDTFEAEAVASPMMGHNNPPEELELVQAVPREEWSRIKAAIDEIRQQTTVEQPDVESVKRSNSRLLAAATALSGWKDLSRFDAAPLIAFTATKESYYGTETDGRIPPRCGAYRVDQWAYHRPATHVYMCERGVSRCPQRLSYIWLKLNLSLRAQSEGHQQWRFSVASLYTTSCFKRVHYLRPRMRVVRCLGQLRAVGKRRSLVPNPRRGKQDLAAVFLNRRRAGRCPSTHPAP